MGLTGGRLRSRTSRSRPSPGASCRITPASTPSSRRPMPRMSPRSGITTPPCSASPFDGGTTYRPGTRFGPQGVRKISALYTPYNYEIGVDLREQMTLCDAGDIFTIPGNIEKTFDQISRAVSPCLLIGLAADHHRRRPFHRVSLRARHRGMHLEEDRHRPFRPPRRHPGKGSRRADAHHARGSTRPTCPTFRPRTSFRSASAAGRFRARR